MERHQVHEAEDAKNDPQQGVDVRRDLLEPELLPYTQQVERVDDK